MIPSNLQHLRRVSIADADCEAIVVVAGHSSIKLKLAKKDKCYMGYSINICGLKAERNPQYYGCRAYDTRSEAIKGGMEFLKDMLASYVLRCSDKRERDYLYAALIAVRHRMAFIQGRQLLLYESFTQQNF